MNITRSAGQASTTLDLYVHHQKTLDSRVTELFDGFW
jgi:hypothetical protein